jgi:general secretion pathway protein H
VIRRIALPLPPCRGFTLIELMVVLIVVGLMSTVLTLGMDSLHARDERQALQRLRLVLEASAERAAVRGRPVQVELLSDGYRFMTLDADDRWRALIDPPLFVERRLPDTLQWAGLLRGGVDAGHRAPLLFGSQAPEFELRIHTTDGEARLSGKANGEVRLHLPGSAPAPAPGEGSSEVSSEVSS